MSVATFHAGALDLIRKLGGTPEFNGRPNEIPDAIPFAEDRAERPYDADAVNRFFRASVAVTTVLQTFRTGYLGKVSPVHLFWGSFDLAVTRFSGRRAPLHPGGIPALPDEITREAYSHEVSSAGFWPGGGPVDFPAFYSYAYPTPVGFAGAKISPDAAYYDKSLGEFLLPYEVFAELPIRKPASSAFWRAHIVPRPTSPIGMLRSNAQSVSLDGPALCRPSVAPLLDGRVLHEIQHAPAGVSAAGTIPDLRKRELMTAVSVVSALRRACELQAKANWKER